MGPRFIFTILITSVMFGAPSFTGDQEDVSRCISAAKGYADVTLSRSNYKCDGGWFSSGVRWSGNTPAICDLGTEVRELVIIGQAYIVDGLTGKDACSIYSVKDPELESIRRT